MEPELLLQQQFDREARQFQEQANQQWDTIKSRVEVLGPEQTMQQLLQLEDKNNAAFSRLKDAYTKKLSSLSQVDSLAQHGFIPNPDEVKFRMVLGPEAERAIFPKAKSIEARYGELDVYRNRLEKRLADFETDPGGERIKQPSKWWFQEYKTRPILKVYSHTTGTGKEAKDVYRPANAQEQQEYENVRLELERVRDMQNSLTQRSNVTNSLRHAAATSNRLGIGTLASNISADLERRKPEPKPEPVKQTKIRVKSPDGVTGTIPAEDWLEAQQAGYVRVD